MLEGALEAVNPEPALRKAECRSKPGKKCGRGGDVEKVRRDEERQNFKRMSRLFKPKRPWQRKEILGLGETILFTDGRG